MDIRFLSHAEQLAAHLHAEILEGKWSGSMPGILRLADELGVNRNTIDAALKLLEKKGVLVGQGAGRKRRIVLPENHAPPALRVGLLLFDSPDRGEDFMIELRQLLEEAGHAPFYSDKGLVDLSMDVRRVARLVKKAEAEAWIVFAASQEVLEWFSAQETPAFGVCGRHGGLPIAGTRPDKAQPVFAEITRRLITQGHRAICCVCRRQHRLPQPAKSARAFLGELEAAGIVTGAFNLPDWEESREGFGKLLDSLFRTTPPTALILDEPFLYYAAHHHLAKRGLQVPGDVSLICTDADPGFTWCDPSVAHIRWEYRPMLRRVVRWANNVALGKEDRRQSFTKAEFVEGGTIGPAP